MIYVQLFWEFLKIGLFAVGGGMAICTKGDEVVRVICAAAAPADDVVQLDVFRGVAQGAPEPIPPIDGLPLCIGELG